MNKECPYCKKIIEYDHGRQFSAHCGNCKKGPNYKLRIHKSKKYQQSISTRKDYIFNCKKCGKKYKVNLTIGQYQKHDYREHCLYKCSNSRIFTQEMKNLRTVKNIIKICPICKTEYECKPGYNKRSCGNKKCIDVLKTRRRKTHRQIMEDIIERKLTLKEVVHHIDGNHTNDNIDNLQIMTISKHVKYHNKERQKRLL